MRSAGLWRWNIYPDGGRLGTALFHRCAGILSRLPDLTGPLADA